MQSDQTSHGSVNMFISRSDVVLSSCGFCCCLAWKRKGICARRANGKTQNLWQNLGDTAGSGKAFTQIWHDDVEIRVGSVASQLRRKKRKGPRNRSGLERMAQKTKYWWCTCHDHSGKWKKTARCCSKQQKNDHILKGFNRDYRIKRSQRCPLQTEFIVNTWNRSMNHLWKWAERHYLLKIATDCLISKVYSTSCYWKITIRSWFDTGTVMPVEDNKHKQPWEDLRDTNHKCSHVRDEIQVRSFFSFTDTIHVSSLRLHWFTKISTHKTCSDTTFPFRIQIPIPGLPLLLDSGALKK